ncbi:hypothetical protein OG21DRAFT_892955 [Imleria badia]|nr:hypothetical protein OG21DRAFT_892955 [Imleria badia]
MGHRKKRVRACHERYAVCKPNSQLSDHSHWVMIVCRYLVRPASRKEGALMSRGGLISGFKVSPAKFCSLAPEMNRRERFKLARVFASSKLPSLRPSVSRFDQRPKSHLQAQGAARSATHTVCRLVWFPGRLPFQAGSSFQASCMVRHLT